MLTKGIFITFEGGEGSGKSVQCKKLAESLTKLGHQVLLTREPGGTDGAEKIRSLVLSGDADRWDPLTESLLYMAARSHHWTNVIKPALDLGKIVISDRFNDSSIVYQGYCKNVDINFLNSIYTQITGGIYPDLTYILSIPPEIGIKRALKRPENNDETRFEKMDITFHDKVLNCFLDLAKTDKRFVLVDGNRDINTIQNEIFENFMHFFRCR